MEMEDWEMDAENMEALFVPPKEVKVVEEMKLVVVPSAEEAPQHQEMYEPNTYYNHVLYPKIEHLLKKQKKNQYSGAYIATICLKNTSLREPEIVQMVLQKRGFLMDGILCWNKINKRHTMDELMDYRNWKIKKNKHGLVGVAKTSFNPQSMAYYM
jgi:hypothetical protein